MKRIFLTLMITFNLIAVNAQEMRQLWIEMPDSIVPYLNKSLRTELADYVTMKMKPEVVNSLQDTTRIEKFTNNYIRVQLNNASKLEIKSLDNSTIALVQTWNGPIAESKLMLFSKEWKLKPFEIDLTPVFEKPDSMLQQRYEDLLNMANITLCEFKLSESDNSLTIKFTVPLLSPNDKTDMSNILKQRKLNWNGALFK